MKQLTLALLLWLLPSCSLANDGFGGLSAIGLQFAKTEKVRMVREDLFLSPERVEVRYLFHNDGPQPVQGEIIFPLPPISLSGLGNADFALDGRQLASDNPVNFTLHIDGKAQPVQVERIAVIEPPYEEGRKASLNYDSPGKDVTALLKEHAIPLSLAHEQVTAHLSRLPQTTLKRLQELQLVEVYEGEPPLPLWSIILRYHWPQSFAAGQDLRIEHSYNPAPPGGIFVWPADQKEIDPYQQQLIRDYCIDESTRRGLVKRLHAPGKGDMAGTGMAVFLDYVLTTANTWKGPIGTFHLTIDKGKPDNILSLCIDGLRKTGPTRFEMEQSNFTPHRDLRLMIVSGLEN